MKKLAAVIVAGALVTGTALAATQVVHTRTLRADPNGALRFSTKSISVPHGIVKLVMRNPGSSGLPHGIAIVGHGVSKRGKIVNPGHSSVVKTTLKRGTYTFYCPFPGHRAAGMKGKLIVG